MLSAPTPIFLLLSGGPRSLGGPRDQSQAVYCGLRSAQLCWVEDEGACRGTLRSLWLPELALLARQAGRCRPHAPVTGTLRPGAPGPFPASQGVAAPPTAQDAGEQGSAPDRPPLPMFCPAGAPRGGPRARQPLHPRAGLPSGWAWGRLRSALGGCSPRMSSPAFGLQRPQQTPVALPWSRRGPAVLSGSELQPEHLGSPGPPPAPPLPVSAAQQDWARAGPAEGEVWVPLPTWELLPRLPGWAPWGGGRGQRRPGQGGGGGGEHTGSLRGRAHRALCGASAQLPAASPGAGRRPGDPRRGPRPRRLRSSCSVAGFLFRCLFSACLFFEGGNPVCNDFIQASCYVSVNNEEEIL